MSSRRLGEHLDERICCLVQRLTLVGRLLRVTTFCVIVFVVVKDGEIEPAIPHCLQALFSNIVASDHLPYVVRRADNVGRQSHHPSCFSILARSSLGGIYCVLLLERVINRDHS